MVEVVVAMLITCVMVTAVMGVAITATRSGGPKNTHRLLFDQAIAALSAQLKGYVTACGCLKSSAAACPAAKCTLILGPNKNVAGANTWNINGAIGVAGVTVADSQGAVWALNCGTHKLTGILPTLEVPPYSGATPGNVISYTVAWPVCNASVPSATDTPAITFAANWTEP